ncbi:MAG TPA: hypothetical protein VGX28_10975 [Frankiaceae bacterium]|nr:hypothetical protein [Frankiaceae bacterium]
MTERPLFIDPIATGDGDEVDHNPAPRWYLALALLILGIAAYYLAAFSDGPRESSPHRFPTEQVGASESAEAH